MVSGVTAADIGWGGVLLGILVTHCSAAMVLSVVESVVVLDVYGITKMFLLKFLLTKLD